MSTVAILCTSVLLIVHVCIGDKPKREHRQLSFLGDYLDSKKPLLNIPIIRKPNGKDPVTLTISPSTLTTPNGVEDIRMSWIGATMAKSSDWIGIYSPPNASDTEWLDWFYTDGTVNGSFQARIWNMRDDYELRYFLNNGNGNYVLEGISNIATVSASQPLQGHISLTKNSPNEMQIRWVSSLINNPTVQIGTKSGQYTSSFNATYYTYDTTNFCGGSASIISPTQFRDPGYIYTAIADGLEAGTRYYYRFGNDKYWSDEKSFITSANDKSVPFEFIMYGDMGTATNSFETVYAIENEMLSSDNNVELVLHVGDISYAYGNGYTWEIWSNMIANIASSVPYMTSIGNHEYDHTAPCNNKQTNVDLSGVGGTGYHPPWGNQGDDSGGECGAPMYYRFNMDICHNQNSIFWYSFNYNSVHFIMLSSEHDYSSGSDGFNFLLNDLQNIDSNRTPWIIVNIHRPLYESEEYSGDNQVSTHLIELLEPTLFKYGVDMVLAGHYHSYERTCAVYNYQCIGQKNGGITHLTVGTGGIGLDNALYQTVDWSVFRDEIDYGFAKFYVNQTTLTAKFIANSIGVVDQVVLTK